MNRNFEVKVVILGDSGVGKSSILMRFVTNEWKENMESTMGAAFMSKMIVHNQNYIKYQVYDHSDRDLGYCRAREVRIIDSFVLSRY